MQILSEHLLRKGNAREGSEVTRGKSIRMDATPKTPMYPQEEGNQKVVEVGILFFLIGFGVSWLIFGRDSEGTDGTAQGDVSGLMVSGSENKKEPAKDEAASDSLPAVFGGTNTISVRDQSAGKKVDISSVNLEHRSWVVIHEEVDGKPARILGAQRFNEGAHSGAVDLLRATEEGKTDYAMLHSDDGDAVFDSKKDAPLEDASGAVIMMRFVTASKAMEQ